MICKAYSEGIIPWISGTEEGDPGYYNYISPARLRKWLEGPFENKYILNVETTK